MEKCLAVLAGRHSCCCCVRARVFVRARAPLAHTLSLSRSPSVVIYPFAPSLFPLAVSVCVFVGIVCQQTERRGCARRGVKCVWCCDFINTRAARVCSDGRCRGSPKPSGGDPDVTLVRQRLVRDRRRSLGYRYRVVLDQLVADKHGR